MQNNDTWTLGGHTFTSRFILGSGKYNLNLIRAAVEDAGAEIITPAFTISLAAFRSGYI